MSPESRPNLLFCEKIPKPKSISHSSIGGSRPFNHLRRGSPVASRFIVQLLGLCIEKISQTFSKGSYWCILRVHVSKSVIYLTWWDLFSIYFVFWTSKIEIHLRNCSITLANKFFSLLMIQPIVKHLNCDFCGNCCSFWLPFDECSVGRHRRLILAYSILFFHCSSII